MAPKLIKPELVKPLFDMSLEQPFLLRPMTGYERGIVNHWKMYYAENIYGKGYPVSEFRDEFIKYLGTRGYSASLLRMDHGRRADLLFQDLFKVAPKITLIPALCRITGLNIKLHESEMRDGFREFVQMHKEKHGDFPRRKDFADACESRLFLPKTGIIVPHPLRLQKRASKEAGEQTSYGIATSYRLYFDVPEEISQDDIDKIESRSKFRLEDLIDNLRKVQKWMDEQTPNGIVALTPSRVDIENYAKANKDGVDWQVYESWIYHGTELLGETPKDAVRSLEWLREQAGIGEERAFVRRPKSSPRGFWTKDRIYNNFCAAWRSNNPRGFQTTFRYLADPPTLKDIESMTRKQAVILEKYGELKPEICELEKVPSVPVPSVSTIRERYKGGYQKLLADIERRIEPVGGINFSSGVQLQRMASAHQGSNVPDGIAPIRVLQVARVAYINNFLG